MSGQPRSNNNIISQVRRRVEESAQQWGVGKDIVLSRSSQPRSSRRSCCRPGRRRPEREVRDDAVSSSVGPSFGVSRHVDCRAAVRRVVARCLLADDRAAVGRSMEHVFAPLTCASDKSRAITTGSFRVCSCGHRTRPPTKASTPKTMPTSQRARLFRAHLNRSSSDGMGAQQRTHNAQHTTHDSPSR